MYMLDTLLCSDKNGYMTHYVLRHFRSTNKKHLLRSYVVFALVVFTVLPLSSYAATPEVEPNTQDSTPELVLDTSVSVGGALRFDGKNIPVTLKIMPLGDSITAGVAIDSQLAYDGSYRTKLWQLLTTAGVGVDYVGEGFDGPADLPDHDHEGHSGIWIKDNRIYPGYTIYDNVIGWLTTYDPDLILLHIGTNDLNNGDSGGLAARKLDALLARIYNTKPTVHLVLALIIQPQTPNKKWQDYNTLASEIANSYAAQGYHISTADMSNTLQSSDYADYLHPVKSGYDKMADAWYPAIQTMLGEW